MPETGLIDELMVVTYMPGGIGAVAYNHMTGVRNDDPNVIVAASTGATANLALGKFGDYSGDEVRWLGALGVDYGAIVVKDDAPWQNLDDLMNALRDHPGDITFGAGGTVGGQDWMKAALTAKAADISPHKLHYVAFEGGGKALEGLLGDHIQVFTGDLSELRSQLDSGKIRVLATLSEERVSGPFADIPTATEQGYDVQWPIWRGYYMGSDVSDEAYQKWQERLKALADKPTFKKMREERGLFPMERFGDDFDAYVQEQIQKFQRIAKKVELTQ